MQTTNVFEILNEFTSYDLMLYQPTIATYQLSYHSYVVEAKSGSSKSRSNNFFIFLRKPASINLNKIMTRRGSGGWLIFIYLNLK